MPEHLFVYGTLRAESGHPMAHRLRVGARHIGKGSTPGLLYDFGSWPGAFFAPEEKYRVIGERVRARANPRLLADLDKYEGVTAADDEPGVSGSRAVPPHRIEVSLDQRRQRRGLDLRLEGDAAGEADRHRRLHRRPPLARPRAPFALNPFPPRAVCVRVGGTAKRADPIMEQTMTRAEPAPKTCRNGSIASAPAAPTVRPPSATGSAARAPISPRCRGSACRFRRASPSRPKSARSITSLAASCPRS